MARLHMPQPMLVPMLALIAWTFVIWVWMYATRIPAMQAAGLDPAKVKRKSDLDVLPARVQQIADNYNHLHEQPTLFYALVAYCVLAGTADGVNVGLAWGYVASRVVHSLVQCTWNFVPVRFAIFSVGSLLLMAITVRCLLALG
jgi:hypothetical protein